MRLLKIKSKKGFFCLGETDDTCVEIDKIDKDKIMKLLDIAVSVDFDMDDYEDKKNKINNPAQEIIYRNLFNKFKEFKENKNLFKENGEGLYKDALEKYGKKKSR